MGEHKRTTPQKWHNYGVWLSQHRAYAMPGATPNQGMRFVLINGGRIPAAVLATRFECGF